MIMKYEPAPTDLLSFTFEDVESNPHKPVIVDASDPSRFVTPRSARTIVRKLIAGFQAEGLESGDCVCVHSFNDIYYPLIYLAIIGAGGRYTGSNPAYTSIELNHHVRTAHVRYLITEPHMLSTALQTAKECNIPTSRLFVFDASDHGPSDGYRSWEELLQHGEADWVRFQNREEASTTVATLGFTSGTTGLPKAAMVSHEYSVSQIFGIRSRNKPYEVSRLICLPAFHAFGMPLISGCAIRYQETVYLMRRFDTKQFVEDIERFHITEIPVVPAMIVAILNSPVTQKRHLQSLRYVWSAGSPLRASTQVNFKSLLASEAKLSQVWGMTETGWALFFSWPEGDDTGSVGRIMDGMGACLKDEDNNLIEEDMVSGELYIKGPCMMLGYLDNPKATAASISPDGWMRTGDIAYCNKGKWYIIDRKKDLIKVRGWQVAPAELEAILLTHPQIINVAVIGIPVPEGTGEVPRAFVVRKPKLANGAAATYGVVEEKEVSEEDIKEYLLSKLSRYKALDGGVQFVDTIPRNATGKTLKNKLREMYMESGVK